MLSPRLQLPVPRQIAVVIGPQVSSVALHFSGIILHYIHAFSFPDIAIVFQI